MSRIRSVHPGLFTDPEFVMLSDAAQVFFIGLWTEADDNGAFIWAPLVLKMKLRPASREPVEPLLEELVALGRIRRYEHDGRVFGVIRNFARYQHPKAPRTRFFIPPGLRRFVALPEQSNTNEGCANYGNQETLNGHPTEPVPQNFPTPTPISSRAHAGFSLGEEEKRDSLALLGPSLRSGLSFSPLRYEKEAPPREREGLAAPRDNQNLIDKGNNLLGRRKRALVAKMLSLYGHNVVNNALDDTAAKHPANPAAFFLSCCQTANEPSPTPDQHRGPQGPPPTAAELEAYYQARDKDPPRC